MNKPYILTPRRRARIVRDYCHLCREMGGWRKGAMLARKLARGSSISFYATGEVWQ